MQNFFKIQRWIASVRGSSNEIGKYDYEGEWAYISTLEEPVEACGNNFRPLSNEGHNDWRTVGTLMDATVFSKGSTPIESVANLWL
jgi:hypothetical protein